MLEFVSVADVEVGQKVNYEYAPGREYDAEITFKSRNPNGTYTLAYKGRGGAVSGYRADDMLLVVG